MIQMQATTSSVSLSPSSDSNYGDEIAESEAQIRSDFWLKLKIDDSDFHKMENSENILEDREQQQFQSESEEEEEEEFSFVCIGPDSSPIAAEDAFQNGQIRPIFPLFNRDLLIDDDPTPTRNQLPLNPPVKNVFIESRDSLPPSPSSSAAENDEIEATTAGQYCNWSKKAVEVSPERCKKSNSTGFSKIWRFRDLLHRSNSDGRDTFVFLNEPNRLEREERVQTIEKSQISSEKKGKKVKKTKTASLSAHELHYRRNRATKEENRRRSYLPYRPGLVGFFTNVNGGLSKNVHPF